MEYIVGIILGIAGSIGCFGVAVGVQTILAIVQRWQSKEPKLRYALGALGLFCASGGMLAASFWIGTLYEWTPIGIGAVIGALWAFFQKERMELKKDFKRTERTAEGKALQSIAQQALCFFIVKYKKSCLPSGMTVEVEPTPDDRVQDIAEFHSISLHIKDENEIIVTSFGMNSQCFLGVSLMIPLGGPSSFVFYKRDGSVVYTEAPGGSEQQATPETLVFFRKMLLGSLRTCDPTYGVVSA